MTDDESKFYQEEKLKFNELLNKLGWTEENLLEKVGSEKRIFPRKTVSSFR